jgi:hypothetical protein
MAAEAPANVVLCGAVDTENGMEELTKSERKQIAEILSRRANEIAGFSGDYRKDGNHFGSVELALSREIERLRRLADRVNPPDPEDEDA